MEAIYEPSLSLLFPCNLAYSFSIKFHIPQMKPTQEKTHKKTKRKKKKFPAKKKWSEEELEKAPWW